MHLTYAITPPNRHTSAERRGAIATAQSAHLAKLPVDALLVYDLQDETARNGAARPFPFAPKVDPLEYAFEDLKAVGLPRVVYRAVTAQDEQAFREWLERLDARGASVVLVGAPSRDTRRKLSLSQALSLGRTVAPSLSFGGVVIAERHHTSGEEAQRVWSKMQQGCDFFVSQTMWCHQMNSALLRDLAELVERQGGSFPRLVFSLSPSGSEQTLRFQEWLGVHVPPIIKRDLLAAKDMLGRSIDLAVDVFRQLCAVASDLGVTIGCNVESVSSRAVELDASFELVRRIAALQGRD